jgi:hypothetical protein
MKKAIYISLFIFLFCVSALAQDVSLPRDVAEKALEALELRPALETRITTLEKVNKELTEAKQTPCTITAEKVKQDYVFWLNGYDTASPEKRKQIDRMLKFVRKSGRKSVAAQCGYKTSSVLSQVWDGVKNVAPFAALWLAL